MTVPAKKVYPRSADPYTVYLDAVVTNPNISIGAYTMYHDFVHDPRASLSDQSRPAPYREVLFHRLRCEIPVYQRPSRHGFLVHLSVSPLF